MKSDKIVWRALAIIATVALSACTQVETGINANQTVARDAPTFSGPMSSRFNRSVVNVVNFEFNSDELDAEAQSVVDAQAQWILEKSNIQFAVTGHTDKVGSNEYNQDLGLRRAQRVVAALIAAGVPEEQLIAMVSLGEESPLIDTEMRERINRRAVTEVLGLIEETGTIQVYGKTDRKRPRNPPDTDDPNDPDDDPDDEEEEDEYDPFDPNYSGYET